MIRAERQRSTPQRATLQSVERRVTYHILLMIRGPYRFRGRYAMGGPGVLSPWRRLAAALASLMRPTDRSRGRPTPGSRFRPDRPRLVRQVSATALVLVVTACGPGRSSVATASPSELDDAAWQVLARPRVPQLTGAVRISVGEIALLDENPWGLDPSVPSSVGISELVATDCCADATSTSWSADVLPQRLNWNDAVRAVHRERRPQACHPDRSSYCWRRGRHSELRRPTSKAG